MLVKNARRKSLICLAWLQVVGILSQGGHLQLHQWILLGRSSIDILDHCPLFLAAVNINVDRSWQDNFSILVTGRRVDTNNLDRAFKALIIDLSTVAAAEPSFVTPGLPS